MSLMNNQEEKVKFLRSKLFEAVYILLFVLTPTAAYEPSLKILNGLYKTNYR